MSLDQMRDAAAIDGADTDPTAALHETDCSGMVAFDDVSGQELVPALMVKARRDEIDYFRKMGVYEKVDIGECWNITGKAPIAVRWVDINKGDSQNPNYRSRLVGKEFKTYADDSLYASTPPLGAFR